MITMASQHAFMEWSECTAHEGTGGANNSSSGSAPTIKNHSVTHFGDYLYCFGGYDGRRNHMTLLLYCLRTHRWIQPHHDAGVVPGPSSSSSSSNGNRDPTNDEVVSPALLLQQQQQQQQQQHQLPHNNNNPMDIDTNNDNMENDTNNNNSSSNNNNNNNSRNMITVQGTPPPGRNGHSATLAALEDDGYHGRIIIIGGWLGTGPLAASDMHVLEIAGPALRWYQPTPRGTPPGPCNMHSADCVVSPSGRKEVYVFRGGNGREYLNDLHALTVDTLTWRKVETVGAIPQQRANHSSAVLEETNELFIFGGWNGTQRLNDIHILDVATSVWTCPKIGGVLPHPRAGMTLTALRGRLYLFGGSGTSAKCFQDLQILDRNEMAWLDVVSHYDTRQHHHHHLHHNMNHHHHVQYDMRHDASNPATNAIFRFGGARMYENQSESGNAMAPFYADGNLGDDSNMMMMMMSQQGDASGEQDATWLSTGGRPLRRVPLMHATNTPNPNDEDTVPSVLVYGQGPGRRAGHTATAVNRKIYIFGGSCGSDYLNDFFVLDTDPSPHACVTELTSVQLLERRLRNYFNDEEFADVTFVVQGQKVYGHKMILSIVSDCFRAMFSTGFRESEEIEIEIPDCSYAAFFAVMEYIYTGTLPSFDVNRNLQRVVEMLELADRFILEHLKQLCETMLQPAVNNETVEFLLSVAQKTNAGQLQAVCEHLLRNRDAAGVPFR